MASVTEFFGSGIVPLLVAERLAWTLIHFLWQGLACAAVGLLLLRGLGCRRPHARYGVWLSVLLLMAAAPVVTWVGLSATSSVSQETAYQEIITSTSTQDAPQQAEIEWTSLTIPASWWSESFSQVETPGDESEAELPSVAVLMSRHWPQAVVVAWLLGILITSLRLVGAAAWIWCIVSRLQPASDETVRLARQLGRRLGLHRIPRIAISGDVAEPLALQWFRPIVLLPASWLADVPPGVLEAVLAHELAHIRRRDLWVNLGQRVVETLLFFHPCVWWVSKQIRIERELCCDADAVSATGQPVQYAQALEVVARRRWACASSRLAVGMGGPRMALLNRVKRVLGVESTATGSDWWTLGLAGAGVSVACWLGTTLWTAPVQGDETADALAVANAEEELRPAPPRREGDKREEERERDGERREGEARRPERPPPREERGPREGDRPEGRREGGERGPGREGPPPPRPPHEITEELANVIRESAERGEPIPREQVERLMRELQQGHEAMLQGRGREGRPGPFGPDRPGPFGPGPFGPGREGPGEPGMRGPGGPPVEIMQDMMHAIHQLREEVGRLRAEMNEMRGHRPPGPPRDGEREGPPRGPRDGEGPPPRGPRDGEGPPPRGPRDGDREGPPRGPRDGEGPPRGGPRDQGGPRPESRPDAA